MLHVLFDRSLQNISTLVCRYCNPIRDEIAQAGA